MHQSRPEQVLVPQPPSHLGLYQLQSSFQHTKTGAHSAGGAGSESTVGPRHPPPLLLLVPSLLDLQGFRSLFQLSQALLCATVPSQSVRACSSIRVSTSAPGPKCRESGAVQDRSARHKGRISRRKALGATPGPHTAAGSKAVPTPLLASYGTAAPLLPSCPSWHCVAQGRWQAAEDGTPMPPHLEQQLVTLLLKVSF